MLRAAVDFGRDIVLIQLVLKNHHDALCVVLPLGPLPFYQPVNGSILPGLQVPERFVL